MCILLSDKDSHFPASSQRLKAQITVLTQQCLIEEKKVCFDVEGT
jgi:hypothetical protein